MIPLAPSSPLSPIDSLSQALSAHSEESTSRPSGTSPGWQHPGSPAALCPLGHQQSSHCSYRGLLWVSEPLQLLCWRCLLPWTLRSCFPIVFSSPVCSCYNQTWMTLLGLLGLLGLNQGDWEWGWSGRFSANSQSAVISIQCDWPTWVVRFSRVEGTHIALPEAAYRLSSFLLTPCWSYTELWPQCQKFP